MKDVAQTVTPRDQLDTVLKLGRRTFRYWWVALALTLFGGAATLAWDAARTKSWRSDAVLLYREGIRWSSQEGGGESTFRVGQRLKETVLARSRLEKVISEVGLYPDIVASLGFAEAVQELRRHVEFRVGEGDTFVLSFEGPSAETAQVVTARLSAMLVEENRRYRAEQAEVTKGFLDGEKQRNETDLRQKESQLAQFLAQHPEFAQDTGTQQGAAGAAIRAGSRENARQKTGDAVLLALEREQARLRRRVENPDAPLPAAPRPQDPALLAARADALNRLNAAKRNLAEKQAVFTEQHPDVRQAAAELKVAEAAYKKAFDALAAADNQPAPNDAPKMDKEALVARLAQVDREVAARRAAIKGEGSESLSTTGSTVAERIVELETEWARLNREVVETRDRYQQLESKQFLAEMAATSVSAGQAAQVVVVDTAFLPQKPLGPGRFRLLAMGLAAALAGGLLLAFALGLVDDRIDDELDALEVVGPVLCRVPRLSRRRTAQAHPTGEAG